MTLKPGREYKSVHYRCELNFGLAKSHLCIWCLGDAFDWAYLFTGEVKTCPHSGRPYSDRIDDYAPLCRSCHKRWDLIHDPVFAETMHLTGVAAGKRPKTAAHRVALSKANNTSPEHFAALQAGATRGRARKYQCEGCTFVSNAGNVGKHHSQTGHGGKKEVMPS